MKRIALVLLASLLGVSGAEAGPRSPTADTRAGYQPVMLKIGIEEDGLYRLTHAQLRDAGLDLTGVDPRTIKTTHRDREIPITVHGEEDGVIDVEDYVEFYGMAMTGPFTARNVYRLTAGEGSGRRMDTRQVQLTDGPTATSFWRAVHVEEDHVYWQNPPPGARDDHWFWQGYLQAPATATVTFSLVPPAPGGAQAVLRVGLQGRSDDLAVRPDHHTRIALNGTPVDEATWDGQVAFAHQVAVPHSLLQGGPNTLRVEMPGDTGAEVDQVYVNWVEVEYQAAYVAVQDRLVFQAPAPGTQAFAVGGFSAPDIVVFDISDPEAPVQLVNPLITNEGDVYTLRFQDTVGEGARYLAVASAGVKEPVALVLDRPSDLRATANVADYLVITHPELEAEAGRLAAHRRDQGFRPQVVLVDDIYDEFNGGVFDPAAIRDFLRHAYLNWAVPPQYVVLAGDANLDYRDNFGTGHPNYVPTHLFDTWPLGETPNDDWFAQMDDDLLPDLFIGRLPAQTSQDVQVMVDKIIAYESATSTQPWQRTALFVADDDLTDFETISDELIGLLPRSYGVRRVYARQYRAPADPTADIVQAFNEGALLVSYLGHGATDRWGTWAGGRIFALENIDHLANADRLPFLVTGTCLNGFFAHPFEPYSLAEAFVRAPGSGAVAAWSPTGLGSPYQHRLLFRELFAALFHPGEKRLGPAIAQAKAMAYTQDPGIAEVLQTFVLFGDPALRLATGETLDRPLIYLPLMLKGASP